ncbi:MAG TPA: acyltransferase [Caulobacteraceae bacterium]|jgi:exopolysaccharide production protein ExoZ|nr:acyltransferase [Caulobacteraceae bacterium]
MSVEAATTAAAPRDPTFRSIQYLRGVAALAVVCFHAFQWTNVYGLTATDFPTGAAGVDVFFVISGFVMWVTTDRDPPKPLEFLRRRAVRILPPYWLFTLVAAALALTLPGVFQDIRLSTGNLLLSMLLIPHLDPAGDAFPLLKPGWTLCYEAAFYILFAIALLFAPARRRLLFLAIALMTITIAGSLSKWASVLLANPLMLEFLGGVLLGAMWRSGRLGSHRRGLSLMVVAFAALVYLQSIDYRDYDWRPLFWGVPAVILVTGAVDFEAKSGLPNILPLKWLGDASFSIYLCHPLVIETLARLGPLDSAWMFVPEAMVGAVAAGLIVRQVFEKPTLYWLNGVGRGMPGFAGR